MDTPETSHLMGRPVIDPEGQKVGVVKDVVIDDETMEPRWAGIEYGLTHHKTLVPLSALYTTEDGDIATLLSKDLIHHAPRVHGDAPTSEFQHYYGSDAGANDGV
jgi:hypothetical protein